MNKINHTITSLLILAAALLASGCDSPVARIQSHLDYYGQLPAPHQQLIQQGRVALDFTPREVYLAWGAPARSRVTTDAEGEREVWVYTRLLTETRYHLHQRYDQRSNTWRTIEEPWYLDHETVIREAVFVNNRLVSWTVSP